MDSMQEDDEEWAEFDKTFPAYFDTTDKSGRPLLEVWYGDWNTRQGVLFGQSRKLTLSFGRYLELTTRRVFKARAEGKAISQGNAFIELENFNVISGACVTCLPVLTSWVAMNENNYPYLMDNIMLINIPQSFNVVLRLVSPIFTDYTSRTLKQYPNRRDWQKVLDELIDKNQRSVRLGGTIVRE